MWPFNNPLHRGPGGALMPRGSYAPAALMGGGAPMAPQGGMFNAWPSMLGGPQPTAALPGPGGTPALAAPQASPGFGGFGSALSNMLKGGVGANAFSLFGSPQGADVKEQIRQQFLKAGRPDPFATDAAQAQIPDLTNAQYPMQPTIQAASPVPLPQARPQMQMPMPQPRPDMPQQPDPMSFFGGPGSMSFGAGEGASGNNYGNNQGILAALFNR